MLSTSNKLNRVLDRQQIYSRFWLIWRSGSALESRARFGCFEFLQFFKESLPFINFYKFTNFIIFLLNVRQKVKIRVLSYGPWNPIKQCLLLSPFSFYRLDFARCEKIKMRVFLPPSISPTHYSCTLSNYKRYYCHQVLLIVEISRPTPPRPPPEKNPMNITITTIQNFPAKYTKHFSTLNFWKDKRR